MKNNRKKNPNKKICERCGNGGYTAKTTFRCRYCGWMNGLDDFYDQHNAVVTYGGIDDRQETAWERKWFTEGVMFAERDFQNTTVAEHQEAIMSVSARNVMK